MYYQLNPYCAHTDVAICILLLRSTRVIYHLRTFINIKSPLKTIDVFEVLPIYKRHLVSKALVKCFEMPKLK